ncbi:maturin-like isoform X2 [Sinocyclocheilus grahami]|uniref:maturin-like isoform X2 n=1 Tax=Sinocyclocheilus grahami TaxID=75366 RepID=UPI0007AC9AFE|nr:PREDICTED: maturin-like isoform X2 [Sinocyclocheilus grahami]
MEFKELVDTAEKWCSGNPFDLIFAEDVDERRLDFYAEPGISFYVLCPDNLTGGTDNFLAQDYISSCGKKTLLEVLDKVFRSFRPLLGLPDIDDDAFDQYHADVEEEPEPDHQQMGVSQQ